MYKVLLKNLNGDSVKRIFAKAFEDIASRFESRLIELAAARQEGASPPSGPQHPYGVDIGATLGDRLALDIAYLNEQLGKHTVISAPLQGLLMDLTRHVQARLSTTDEAWKAIHP